MLSTLAEKIHDGRFLQLIDRMLKAGYLEDWRWNDTLSGAPQGGVVSPILSNIYLDRFDQFVEQQLIPDYDRGRRRRTHPAYENVENRIARAKRRGDREAVRALKRERRTLPSQDPGDPGYRRLRYVRYCDDFLLGFAGPKREAEEIKARIKRFLHDELKLELSESKIWSRTPPARRRVSLATRSGHSTPIQRSPGIAGRSTALSACSCPGPSSGNDVHAI